MPLLKLLVFETTSQLKHYTRHHDNLAEIKRKIYILHLKVKMRLRTDLNFINKDVTCIGYSVGSCPNDLQSPWINMNKLPIVALIAATRHASNTFAGRFEMYL